MKLKQQLVTALLILFVLSGQAMAAHGVSSCDMDMHQTTSQMDHSAMGHDMMDMDKSTMSCCDDKACAMDCSFIMTSILPEQSSFNADRKAFGKIAIPSTATVKRSSTSLFRPPISS